MRITFLNPPFLPGYSRSQRSPGVIKSGTMYYPYWLAHAAALCDEKGHKVTVIDAPADGLDLPDTLFKLRSFSPDMVVIDTSTPSFESDKQTARAVKELFPKCLVTLCGTHATALPESAVEPGFADAVFVGEYDFTALQVTDAMSNGAPLTNVPGLYLPQTGLTAQRSLIEDLDVLPYVAPIYERFLNVAHYRFSLASYPMVMLISGRGCPNRCFFCLYPQVMHGRKYRSRSPEHLAGEMEYAVKNMPRVREVVFEDDTFTADENRVTEFCEILLRRGIRIPWFANVRVDTALETLAVMKRAGVRSCAVGFETGAQDLLGAMGKGITVHKARRFMEGAKRLGILVHGCFMVGFPGETERTMQQTLDYAIDMEPDSAQFYPVFPYPGTEAYVWAEKNGYLTTNDFRQWLTQAGGHACVLDLPGLPAKRLWEFCENATRAFHFRPKYILRKLLQAFFHPSEGIRSARSFLFYLRYLFKGSDT